MVTVSTLRSTYHHGDLRATLLATVDDVLAERGLEGLSLREVSRRARVSHAAAYKHFADKAALLDVYADAAFFALEAALEAARAGAASPRDALIRTGVAYVVFAWHRPAAFRVMFRPGVSGCRAFDAEGAAERARAVLVATVAAAQAAGAVPPGPLETQVLACWSLVHGLATLVNDGPSAASFSSAVAVASLARDVIATILIP